MHSNRWLNLIFTSFILAGLVFLVPISKVEAFAGGTGVEGDPFLVSSCTELMSIDETVDSLSKFYLVTTDLDCTSNGNSVMIATSAHPFNGNFNGGGHTITVAISSVEMSVGLFRQIQNGIVTDVRVAGTVTGGTLVGGLVGFIDGASSILERVANIARVQGTNTVGGLVGDLRQGIRLSDCYNWGNVYAPTSNSVGGIAGIQTWIPMNRCYSRGTVTGSDITGGLVGYLQGSAVISNSFSASRVKSLGGMTGGIVGYFAFGDSSSSVHNYWDVSRSGETECVGYGHDIVASGVCERKNVAWVDANTFKNNDTNQPFPGLVEGSAWDFTPTTGVWDVVENGYPALQSIANDDVGVNDNESVPSAPLSLQSSAQTSSSVTLTWLPPASDGFHDISGYQVQKSLAGADVWTSAGSDVYGAEFFAVGLLPETEYDFRVYATNSVGQSDASDIGTFATTAYVAPVMPAISSAQASSSTISMSWTGSDNGTEITSYVVQYKVGIGSQLTHIASADWTIGTFDANYLVPYHEGANYYGKIVGLQPATSYEVRVKVTNAAGDSEYSDPYSTTTLDPIRNIYTESSNTSVYSQWDADGSTNQKFKYGTTSALGQEANATPNGNWANVSVSNLLPNTEYFYKIAVTYGAQQYESELGTFSSGKQAYTATDELGQINEEGGVEFSWGDSNLNEFGFSSQSGVALDTIHHRLYVADGGGDGDYNNRIMVFNLNEDNTPIDHAADFVLGQEDFETSDSGVTRSMLNKPRNVVYDNVHDRLFVSDGGNHRVLVYVFTEENPLETGMNASYVLGQADFTHRNSSATQNRMSNPMGMSYDSVHDRLYVAEMGNNRVLVFDVRPAGSPASSVCGVESTGIANGMNASCLFGQVDFTSNDDNVSQTLWEGPRDVAYDSRNEMLYVADSTQNRVLAYDVREASTPERTVCGMVSPGLVATDGDNPLSASCVLGQTNFEDNDSDTSNSTLSVPRGLWYDSVNDRLYVAEVGNERVMAFSDMAHISSGMSASAIIGSGDFDSTSGDSSQSAISCANAVTFDSMNNRLYVSDACNNRIMMFDLIQITTSTLPNGTKGTTYNQTIVHEHGQGTATYSLASGALPAGVTLSGGGVLSGKPTEVGTFNFSLKISDTVGDTGVHSSYKTLGLTVVASSVVTVVEETVHHIFGTPTPTPEVTDTPEPEKVLLNEFSEYMLGEGKTFDLKGKQTVYFLANGDEGQEEHSATVTEIGSDFVVVTIASTPTTLRLGIGETKLHDATGDGVMDVSVKLNSITKGIANLTFSQVLAVTSSPTPTTTTLPTVNVAVPAKLGKGTNWWLWLFAFVAVIGAGIVITRKQNK